MKKELQISTLQRMVFAFILLDLLYRFYSSALLHDIAGASIPFTSLDLTYIAFHVIGLPDLFTSAVGGLLFDFILISMVSVSLIKTKWRWPPVFSCALLFTYMIIFNSYTNHHYHSMVGMILICLPFCFNNEMSVKLLWQTVRYYLLFIFVSAALWKLFRGAIFEPEHMASVLKEQHIMFLSENRNLLIEFMIKKPMVSYILFLFGFCTQLAFFTGFITEKLDRLLLILLIIFMIMNITIMHVFSFELLILGLTLSFNPFVKTKQD